jgi:hypothetical protein
MAKNKATFNLSITFNGNTSESPVSWVVTNPDGCETQGTNNIMSISISKANMYYAIEKLKNEVDAYYSK